MIGIAFGRLLVHLEIQRRSLTGERRMGYGRAIVDRSWVAHPGGGRDGSLIGLTVTHDGTVFQ